MSNKFYSTLLAAALDAVARGLVFRRSYHSRSCNVLSAPWVLHNQAATRSRYLEVLALQALAQGPGD